MGPALMDDEWIYGGRLEQIHQTLVEGRPNGMPAWGGKIPDDQLWQIAAYVRSMSLPATLAAQNGPTPSQSPAPVRRRRYGLAGATGPHKRLHGDRRRTPIKSDSKQRNATAPAHGHAGG